MSRTHPGSSALFIEKLKNRKVKRLDSGLNTQPLSSIAISREETYKKYTTLVRRGVELPEFNTMMQGMAKMQFLVIP